MCLFIFPGLRASFCFWVCGLTLFVKMVVYLFTAFRCTCTATGKSVKVAKFIFVAFDATHTCVGILGGGV